MVVEYPSGAEGSSLSLFTITPRVLLRCTGSAVPMVFPQILISVGLSCLALYLEAIGRNPLSDVSSPLSVGILVSFLLVFKTQNAYNQFWHAMDALDSVLHISRSVALSVCTIFNWDLNADVKVNARKIVRLLVLHFFVLVEYFQRTGANAQTKTDVMDSLREDIRQLAGPYEFRQLYPDEEPDTAGSKSEHVVANPIMVIYWIQLAISRVHHNGGCQAPVTMGLENKLEAIMKNFSKMNEIDKTQFPFPYGQIVKILVLFWVFTTPFTVVSECGAFTPVIGALVALGFFGLDEVAEILDSPFGNDPNDIILRDYGTALMRDLEMIYNCRDQKLDSVLNAESELNFRELLAGHFMIDRRNSPKKYGGTGTQSTETYSNKNNGTMASVVPLS